MAKRTTLTCLFAILIGISAFGPEAPAQTLDKFDPLLQPRLSSLLGSSQIIVRATDSGSVGAVALLIQQGGGVLGRDLPIIDGFAAQVPNALLLILAGSPIVEHISLDRPTLGALERTGPTTGATSVREDLGYDGAGVGVAVIDSGITPWHDDLAQATGLAGSQRVDAFVDFVKGRSQPYDDYGHGTHVAGIIAGNGADTGGTRSGIAPATRLVVAKVLDGSGRGRVSDAIAALDYVMKRQRQFNIRIVNLSIAAAVNESYNVDPLTIAARRLVERGVVVVAAAGNLGVGSQGTQYGGITAPGNAPWVLTAGASSHMGTVDRSDDTIAAFSSRGPTAIDRAAKPDLVAPGVGIYSLSAPNSALYSSKSQYLLSGSVATPYLPYLSLSGTSQAAPVAAGTIALMLQANPTLTPNAVKAILQFTAQQYPGYDALTQGAGFLNARGAVDLARAFAASPAGPLPSSPGWSRQLIWGTHLVQGGDLTADANAWSTDVVWGSATTSQGQAVVWGTSQWVQTATNVVWGSTCGGADCQGVSWSAADSGIGGTSEEDTIVWGTTCDGSTCRPVIW